MPDPSPSLRRRSLIAGAIAVASLMLAGGAVAVAATRAVKIADFTFSPATLTITAGDRVRWTNSDSVAHTATATNGSFDTGNIEPGESASVRFTQPGTYRYTCTPHPTMNGTIRVRAPGALPTDPPTDAIAPPAPVKDEPGAALALLVAAACLVVGVLFARRRIVA